MKTLVSGFFLGLLSLVVSFRACSVQTPTQSGQSTPTLTLPWSGELPPFYTSTPSETVELPKDLPKPTSTLKPTATPFTHTIVKDDSLLGIALKYGVTVDDLKTANPEINPRLLSIGQVIVIPTLTQQETALPFTSTPIPIRLSLPVCFQVADGSLVCLAEVYNDQPFPMENVSLRFSLYTYNGNPIASQVSILPLDILGSGKKLPVSATFLPPLPDELLVRVEVETALIARDLESRYLDIDTITQDTGISEDGKWAHVNGQIVIGAPGKTLKGIAVAYDAEGGLAGYRVWKSETNCQIFTPEPVPEETTQTPVPPQPCGPLDYEITVYSLGPTIARIEVAIEAKP